MDGTMAIGTMTTTVTFTHHDYRGTGEDELTLHERAGQTATVLRWSNLDDGEAPFAMLRFADGFECAAFTDEMEGAQPSQEWLDRVEHEYGEGVRPECSCSICRDETTGIYALA